MERQGPRDSKRNQETPICWWLNRRGNHDCKGERKEDGNAAFELHKWHSNITQLESDETKQSPEDQTYAKQQLGIPEGGGGAILGLQWDKQRDVSSVAIPVEKADNTKRGVLAKIAKIYDWSVGTNSYPLILLRSGWNGSQLYQHKSHSREQWSSIRNQSAAKPFMSSGMRVDWA